MNGRTWLVYLYAPILLLFMFIFTAQTTYSASRSCTHVECAAASICELGAPLCFTPNFPFTTVTNLSAHYIYRDGVPSPCTPGTCKSPEAATFPLLLLADLLPVRGYPVRSLAFPLDIRPGDGIALRLR